jgi:hypothetical protein
MRQISRFKTVVIYILAGILGKSRIFPRQTAPIATYGCRKLALRACGPGIFA